MTGESQTKNSLDWIGQHWAGVIAISAIAAASGWALARHHEGKVAEAGTRTPSVREQSVDPAPRIAPSPEGSGTASEGMPIEREEQPRESGEAVARFSQDDLTVAFASGTDSERLAALTKALQHDIELPPDFLINAYTNDASDEVRLLAFTTYIDSVSDDVEIARAALQSATNNTSPIVQAEAYRRLDDLASYEAGMAAAAAQGMP